VGGSTFVIHDKLLVVEFVVIEGWFVNGYWNSLSIVYSGWKVVISGCLSDLMNGLGVVGFSMVLLVGYL